MKMTKIQDGSRTVTVPELSIEEAIQRLRQSATAPKATVTPPAAVHQVDIAQPYGFVAVCSCGWTSDSRRTFFAARQTGEAHTSSASSAAFALAGLGR